MSASVNFVLSERSIGSRSTLLALEGETTPAAAAHVKERLDDIVARRDVGLVIVDLSSVSFLDSTTVQGLAAACAAARARGTRMLVVEPVDPNVARPLELGRLDLVAEVAGTIDVAARLSGFPAGSLRTAVRTPAQPAEPSTRARRVLFGRRKADQEIWRELAQLRRMVLELQQSHETEPAPPPSPDVSAELDAARREVAAAQLEADRMEADAEEAHARIQALEGELEGARSEADQMEAEAESAHARVQALEDEVVALRAQLDQIRAAVNPPPLEPVITEAPEPLGPRKTVPVWSDPTPIDLNEAGLDDLMMLPGIGRRPAERILAFRDSHGGFRSVDELFEITEIPHDRLARIRPYVRV